MCLLAIAWKVHPELPLIFVGNRDEFHAREAAPAGWWDEPAGILGGRDLEAGGSWLAVNRGGRLAVVTNVREPFADSAGQRSRGELVVDALSSLLPFDAWAAGLAERGDRYGGFNLLVADGDRLHCLSNRSDDRLDLAPGIYGLSNDRLDTPWPKVVAARERLRELLSRRQIDAESLFGIVADRRPAPDEQLPHTGVPLKWERALSAAFIVGPGYGTRASTVVLRGRGGGLELFERSFLPDGSAAGESRFEISSSSPPAARRRAP
jgi:uncharacterized protein with NRDE domain